MTFADMIKNDRDNVIFNNNELSQDITYTPKGGADKTIRAIPGGESEEPEENNRQRKNIKRMTIMISLDPTLGVANPSNMDKVTIDGNTWSIVDLQDKNTLTGTINLNLKITIGISGGFRQ